VPLQPQGRLSTQRPLPIVLRDGGGLTSSALPKGLIPGESRPRGLCGVGPEGLILPLKERRQNAFGLGLKRLLPANHPESRQPSGCHRASLPNQRDICPWSRRIKNEGRYLREWIEFQRLMGVEQVYLYDNGSTDNTNEVVAAYVAEGFVITIPWITFDVKAHSQFQSYAHALCNFGPQFRWMAFIDLDEFVFPVTARNLVEVLSGYEDCPALRRGLVLVFRDMKSLPRDLLSKITSRAHRTHRYPPVRS
jgi:Glycosyltransferase family 92